MSAATSSLLGALQALKEEHEKIDRAIRALEDLIADMSEPSKQLGLPTISAMVPTPEVSPARYENMTIGDSAVKFLRECGGWRNTSDIVKGLRAGGWETRSRNAYRMIYNILAKRLDNDVVKNGPMWGLKEWERQ